MNNQRGFIQIPLLLFIVFGALVATGGSYYAVKHTPQIAKQNAIVEEKSKTATTSAEVSANATSSQPSTNNPFLDAFNNTPKNETPSSDNPFLNALKQNNASKQPKEPEHKLLNLPDRSTPITNNIEQPTKSEPAVQKEDGGEKRFQDFATKGKQLLTLFEQDIANFKLLTDTIDQHKKRSAEHATKMMDAWIDLVNQNISSASSQYSGMLSSTKNYLAYDRDYLVDYSNSLYDIVSSSYLLSQREVDALQFVKSELEKCLKMDAKEWVALNGQSCTINFFELKPDYSKRLTDGVNKLGEVDHTVLETIGGHTRSAENDVRGDMDFIARHTQLNTSIQASYNSINNQLQQRQTQFKAANTPIKCYTSTNDSIFDQNRTYSTTCQPDTRTPQQICDEKIAAWVGGGAYTSKPSCE